MSQYAKIKTTIKDENCLIESLLELFQLNDKGSIEVYDAPENLYDYMGKIRPQKANIIIRHKTVGPASNDMGFLRNPDGTFTLIVDNYSQSSLKYGFKWQGKLLQKYAEKLLLKEQKKRNRATTVTKVKSGILLDIAV